MTTFQFYHYTGSYSDVKNVIKYQHFTDTVTERLQTVFFLNFYLKLHPTLQEWLKGLKIKHKHIHTLSFVHKHAHGNTHTKLLRENEKSKILYTEKNANAHSLKLI